MFCASHLISSQALSTYAISFSVVPYPPPKFLRAPPPFSEIKCYVLKATQGRLFFLDSEHMLHLFPLIFLTSSQSLTSVLCAIFVFVTLYLVYSAELTKYLSQGYQFYYLICAVSRRLNRLHSLLEISNHDLITITVSLLSAWYHGKKLHCFSYSIKQLPLKILAVSSGLIK